MPNIRELNAKITSLRNMQKVMRAMNMIASIKLRKIIDKLPALRHFDEGARDMARDIALTFRQHRSPLIDPVKKPEHACIVLFTADKGLCGSHNNTVQRAANVLMQSLADHDISADTVCIGLRGAAFCRRNNHDVYLSTESNERILDTRAQRKIARTLVDRLLEGDIQQVHLVYNRFISTLQQALVTEQVLPLSSLLPTDLPSTLPEFTLESSDASPDHLVTTVFFFLLQSALRHSHLSEHAARMTAMDNATNNSEDLIARYGAIKNRARQTRITNDLTEIVAGKEALQES